MSEYTISEVHKNDRFTFAQIDKLLEQGGIRRDANLDYTCAAYDDDTPKPPESEPRLSKS